MQSCCSGIFSLWVLLLDSTVGRLVCCRGIIEAACWMKNVENAVSNGQEAAPAELGSPQVQ